MRTFFRFLKYDPLNKACFAGMAMALCLQLHAGNQELYSHAQQDTLRIGNSSVEYSFILAGQNTGLISIVDKHHGLSIVNAMEHALFSFGEETGNLLEYEGPSIRRGAGRVGMEPLDTEMIFKYPNVWVKLILSIWPGTKALEAKFFLRSASQNIRFAAAETVLFHCQSATNHLKYEAIEFLDQTDLHNSLVHKTEVLGYTRTYPLKGNILKVHDLVSGIHHWVLKKAPCSGVQLHYPGHDFIVKNNQYTLTGAGIAPDDLQENEWIPAYGFVLGAPVDSEFSILKDLRLYQKNSHLSEPRDLEMVMMNTWGDRNRDASIGESFIRNEIDAASRLGITHFQIDDGWQRGKSMNSADAEGSLWESWTYEDWQPSPERFPNGLGAVTKYANDHNIQLGLWFNPSRTNDYENWKTDADIIIRLYHEYGIRFFKIDGIDLPGKQAEINLRKFYQRVQEATNHDVVFNIDATAGRRGGYFYLNDYGNIFLENRYTDWANYYPYQTLRNLWILSACVPPEKLQIEFLNKWRNAGKYAETDPFRPQNIPFDYIFATSMMAQPLAWFEGSGLPDEAFSISQAIKKYTTLQYDLHQGIILPIGNEPDGSSWTGFQSIKEGEGYFLIFREHNDLEKKSFTVYDLQNVQIQLEPLIGDGMAFTANLADDAGITFELPGKNTFCLYHYKVIDHTE